MQHINTSKTAAVKVPQAAKASQYSNCCRCVLCANGVIRGITGPLLSSFTSHLNHIEENT